MRSISELVGLLLAIAIVIGVVVGVVAIYSGLLSTSKPGGSTLVVAEARASMHGSTLAIAMTVSAIGEESLRIAGVEVYKGTASVSGTYTYVLPVIRPGTNMEILVTINNPGGVGAGDRLTVVLKYRSASGGRSMGAVSVDVVVEE